MLPSGFLAHILPPSIDSCWLGFGVHASPRAIQSLPFPLRGLHPLTWMRSPVPSGCSAACRSRGSCPTHLSSVGGYLHCSIMPGCIVSQRPREPVDLSHYGLFHLLKPSPRHKGFTHDRVDDVLGDMERRRRPELL